MLNPRTDGVLDREQAMLLLSELQEVQRRPWALKHELRRLADEP